MAGLGGLGRCGIGGTPRAFDAFWAALGLQSAPSLALVAVWQLAPLICFYRAVCGT